MAQYLNPYEGIGNALINIGQNYDLDRRRKREAEEDQKRRRADYMWQAKQEEEADQRKWDRELPKREMQARIDALRLAKAQADLVTATLPRINNLPGAGGSYITEFERDAEGNVTGAKREHIPYTAPPKEPKSVDWQKLYDEKGNVILVDPNDPNNRRETNLLGSPPRPEGPTDYQKQRMKMDRLKAIEAINSEKDADIAKRLGVRASDPAGAMAIRNERARKLREVEAVYATQDAAAAATPASRSFGATAIGSIGQGLMKIGNAVTTTEADIAAGIAEGTIEPKRGAAMLAAMSGGDVSVNLGGNEAKAPAPKTKDAPGSSPDNPIDATSLSKPPKKGTWVKLPSGRTVQVD